MDFFRADVLMIAKLVEIDVLRYTAKNIAVLLSVFSVTTNKGAHSIVVRFYGDMAEDLSRQDNINHWYEVKGKLTDG